jgi:hypothetical protein
MTLRIRLRKSSDCCSLNARVPRGSLLDFAITTCWATEEGKNQLDCSNLPVLTEHTNARVGRAQIDADGGSHLDCAGCMFWSTEKDK